MLDAQRNLVPSQLQLTTIPVLRGYMQFQKLQHLMDLFHSFRTMPVAVIMKETLLIKVAGFPSCQMSLRAFNPFTQSAISVSGTGL